MASLFKNKGICLKAADCPVVNFAGTNISCADIGFIPLQKRDKKNGYQIP